MPVYDRICRDCEETMIDLLEPINAPNIPCPCGGTFERVWLQGAANGVIDDSIPGGLEIKNALCNPDGTPKRYDSHSDIKRAAEAGGWTNHVEHIPAKGSDRSKHTVRWTGAPNCCTPELEAARVKAWHDHEASLKR